MGNQDDTKNSRTSAESSANISAKARLGQIKQQIGPQVTPRKRRKAKTAESPADWSDVRDEFDAVRRMAQTPKMETTGYQRHKEAGKFWVRERVELMFDKGSVREIGSASGTARWAKVNPTSANPMEAAKEKVTDFTPSNNVQGE